MKRRLSPIKWMIEINCVYVNFTKWIERGYFDCLVIFQFEHNLIFQVWTMNKKKAQSQLKNWHDNDGGLRECKMHSALFFLLTKFIRSICYIKENRNKRLHKFIVGFMTKHIDCDDSNT